ncbi:MAG: hypothetical protein HY394_04810 [Candidatus Diapherotrites archaeon]|nr:hypothetical protein [Candidatus Diapherotrites archaeon]
MKRTLALALTIGFFGALFFAVSAQGTGECKTECTTQCTQVVSGSYGGDYCAKYEQSCSVTCKENPPPNECEAAGMFCNGKKTNPDGSSTCENGCGSFSGSILVGAEQGQKGKLTGKGFVFAGVAGVVCYDFGGRLSCTTSEESKHSALAPTGVILEDFGGKCNYSASQNLYYSTLPNGLYKINGKYSAVVMGSAAEAPKDTLNANVVECAGGSTDSCTLFKKVILQNGCIASGFSEVGAYGPLLGEADPRAASDIEGFNVKVTLPDGKTEAAPVSDNFTFTFDSKQLGLYRFELETLVKAGGKTRPVQQSVAAQIGETGCSAGFAPVFCKLKVYNNACIAQRYGGCTINDIISTKKK